MIKIGIFGKPANLTEIVASQKIGCPLLCRNLHNKKQTE